MSRRLLPIFVSLVGACLIGLLIYGVSHQSASRTLDEARRARASTRWRPTPATRCPGSPAPTAASLASLARQGRRAELLGLLVRTLPGRGAAARARPEPAAAPRRDRARRDLSRRLARLRSFVRRYHLTYPNLRDNTGDFAHSYGTDQLPESFVIDRQGHIVAISRGEIDQAFLNRAIALAERS